jgi:hypothetical protein
LYTGESRFQITGAWRRVVKADIPLISVLLVAQSRFLHGIYGFNRTLVCQAWASGAALLGVGVGEKRAFLGDANRIGIFLRGTAFAFRQVPFVARGSRKSR